MIKRRIILKNSFSGFLQVIINSILVFIAIQAFINTLGSELFGIFATITLIGNLNTFSNLGINTALLKYLSEQGKSEESNMDIKVAIIIISLLIIPLSILASIFDKFIIENLFNIPPEYFNQIYYLYHFLIISNIFLIIGQVLVSILDSLQKIYVSNILQTVYSFLYWGAVFLIIRLEYSLNVLGGVILVCTILWFSLLLLYSFRHWGTLKSPNIISNFKRILKKQFSLGSKVYLTSILGFLYEPFSKILISHFLGVNYVAFYDIAFRIKNQLWGLISRILYPLFPLISSINNHSKIRDLIHDLSQKIFYVTIPVVICIIFIANPFVELWIGENIDIISISIIFINGVYLLFSITQVPVYLFLQSKDKATKTIFIQFSNALANTLIFLIFYESLGYYAIILSNTLAILTSFVILLFYQKKYLQSMIFDSFGQIFRLFILLCCIVTVGIISNVLIQDSFQRLILIPIAIFFTSTILFKQMGLLVKKDVTQYFGDSKISSILVYLFVKV